MQSRELRRQTHFLQALGTFLLMIVILAVTDRRNDPPPAGLVPFVLALTLFGIGSTFGAQTGFALNPARDLGPRILTWMAGYGGGVFTFRNQYWLWCPILAPIVGALLATFTYDTLVFTGTESIVNYVYVNSIILNIRARGSLESPQHFVDEEGQTPCCGSTNRGTDQIASGDRDCSHGVGPRSRRSLLSRALLTCSFHRNCFAN